MHISELTKIQEQAFSYGLNNKSLIIASQTDSGKVIKTTLKINFV
jgi:superfamily II DNA/RNA helicase